MGTYARCVPGHGRNRSKWSQRPLSVPRDLRFGAHLGQAGLTLAFVDLGKASFTPSGRLSKHGRYAVRRISEADPRGTLNGPG